MTKTRDLADWATEFPDGEIRDQILTFTQSGTGATERTVESKLKDVVSVKDFGAVGDGTTDDTSAIQAAINATNCLYFPAGTYKITDTLDISKNIELIGAGPATGGTRINQTTSGKDIFARSNVNNTYFGVSGFRLNGARYGFYAYNGYPQKNSYISNCYITTCTTGIQIETNLSTGSTFINACVSNVVIEGCGTGINAIGYAMVNGSSFRDIRILSCNYGIYLEETNTSSITSAVELANFTLESIGTYGMILKGICATITNIYTEQCGETSDVPDISMGDATNNLVTRVCLLHPYFGPLGAARTGNTRIKFEGTACSLDIVSNQASGVLQVNGNNKNAASYINIIGIATNNWSVINFNGAEQRWPYSTQSFSQIKFPATQVASSDPNTLDDYEEGAWTPSLTSTGGGTPTYGTNRTGRYTKIGSTVTASFILDITSVAGLAAGSIAITGLPFAVGSTVGYWNSGSFATAQFTYPSGASDLVLSATFNGSELRPTFLRTGTTAIGATVADIAFASGNSRIVASVTYQVSA